MNIDFNEIVQQKLAQMEAEGVIQKKIEDTLGKSIMDAIDSQLGSYSFKNALAKQMEDGISQVAKDCGLSAYNGFIAEKVKAILSGIVSDDLGKKIETAVSGILVQRYEGIKLSDIFKRYREHVMNSTDYSEKEDRQEFTMELEIKKGYTGNFTYYTCKFCPEPEYDADDYDSVEVRFSKYGNEQTASIRSLTIGGLDMSKTLKFGCLDPFDQFLVNLFLNKTEIIVDADAAENAAEDNAYIDY